MYDQSDPRSGLAKSATVADVAADAKYGRDAQVDESMVLALDRDTPMRAVVIEVVIDPSEYDAQILALRG